MRRAAQPGSRAGGARGARGAGAGGWGGGDRSVAWRRGVRVRGRAGGGGDVTRRRGPGVPRAVGEANVNFMSNKSENTLVKYFIPIDRVFSFSSAIQIRIIRMK